MFDDIKEYLEKESDEIEQHITNRKKEVQTKLRKLLIGKRIKNRGKVKNVTCYYGEHEGIGYFITFYNGDMVNFHKHMELED